MAVLKEVSKQELEMSLEVLINRSENSITTEVV